MTKPGGQNGHEYELVNVPQGTNSSPVETEHGVYENIYLSPSHQPHCDVAPPTDEYVNVVREEEEDGLYANVSRFH